MEAPQPPSGPMAESAPDDREIITAPITTAEEAYDRIINDAVRRAKEVLGDAATDADENWMNGAAVYSFRASQEVTAWAPVVPLSEDIPEDVPFLFGIPLDCRKYERRGHWFAMRMPSIPPELAMVARDFAFFAALGYAERRMGILQDALIQQAARQPGSFAHRAFMRYSTYMRTGDIV